MADRQFRHLDYATDVSVDELGPSAIDDLLDRGDLHAWKQIARAVLANPNGPLADTVLRICNEHHMFGTSAMWQGWITKLRTPTPDESLRELRLRLGLSQQMVAKRLGISQSDVSKLERRADVRISTLYSFVEQWATSFHSWLLIRRVPKRSCGSPASSARSVVTSGRTTKRVQCRERGRNRYRS